MFSSNTLLQPVFAHQDDTYFTGMMKLDLIRYLWLELRQQYDSVYCMLRHKEDIFVRLIGKDEPKRSGVKKKKLKTITNSAARWISDLITEQNRNALIINATLFCEIFDNPKNCTKLTELVSGRNAHRRTGTIVIVFPPFTEFAKEKLLHAPAFANIADPSILMLRNEREVLLFPELASNKPDACVFLNVFDEERVGNIVKRVIMERPERFVSMETLEEQISFLTHYLNDHMLSMRVDIINNVQVLSLHYFRFLYNELLKPEVWKKLCNEINACKEAGSYSEYLKQKGIMCPAEEKRNIFTARDPNLEAGKYMMLTAVGCKAAEGEYYERNIQLLNSIYNSFLNPKNTEENEFIIDCLKKMRSSLTNAISETDHNSYFRILRAAEFLAKNLYMAKDSSKQEVLVGFYALFENNISCAAKFTRACKELTEQHFISSLTAGRKAMKEKAFKNLELSDDTLVKFINYFYKITENSNDETEDLEKINSYLVKMTNGSEQPSDIYYTDDHREDMVWNDDNDSQEQTDHIGGFDFF